MNALFDWFERILWIAVFVFVTLFAAAAFAEEKPCRAEGASVVCTRVGFDTLVAKLVDADAAAKTCAVKLDAEIANHADTKKALTACLATPVPAEPPKPSNLRAIVPTLVATVGAAVLATAVTVDLGAGGRAAGAVVGLAAVSTGFILALP